MAKYDTEFKLKVVQEYLAGPLGYRLLAKKYDMRSPSLIARWVQMFRAFGPDGLERKRESASYSVQFKMDVLKSKRQTGSTNEETAIAFGMNNPSLVASWSRAFQAGGMEGLKSKTERGPAMPKKPKKQRNKPVPANSREELERENELLRLENAYLKKLEAFQKDPDAFLEKHRQQWHSNSNKKDSD